MDQEEDYEESGSEPLPHGTGIAPVFDSPEEEAQECAKEREREVSQTVDVESLERTTYRTLDEAVDREKLLR